MATLRDVAKNAGVCDSQVSFVVNQRNLHLVSKERQDRILKAIEEVNYRPHRQARQIRQGRTNMMGMLLSADRWKGSTIAPQIEGAVEASQTQNYFLSLLRLADREITEGALPVWIENVCIDGLILHYNQGMPSHVAEAIEKISLPVIWLNSRRSHDCVHADEEEAGRLATATLLKQGHQRIAFVNPTLPRNFNGPSHHSVMDRRQGFEQAMYEARLEPLYVDFEAPSQEQSQALSDALSKINNPPTALIMTSRWHAPGARCVVQSLGLLGLNNQPVDILTFVPTLDDVGRVWNQIQVVLIPQKQMGAMAVDQLIQKTKKPQELLAPAVLQPTKVFHWSVSADSTPESFSE